MKKTLMKGNHAAGEAAVRAGCMLYAGYPITPSTEIMEHLSARMPEEGRVFIQAENEIASIHMVGGAYCTGKRAMTATSAGGFSLMQEFTAYASDAELPFDERGRLDLKELCYQELVSEIPSVLLCSEDCKGLCPICGRRNPCACTQETNGDVVDERLAILKTLL